MRPIRAAFLGTGGIAATHRDRLERIPGVEVVAACGTSLAKAEAFLAGRSGAVAYADITRLLADAAPDALWVCLPPNAHHGQVEAAAARGVHCFLEKPIARTVARGRSIADAIARAGVVSQVGFHMRFTGPSLALRAAIADGSAGRPTLFQGAFLANHLHGPWWRDVEASGGQLFEQVIHLYDLACWLLGDPAAVSATMANLCHREVADYSVEDTSAGMVRFASGAAAAIVGSNCAVPMEWSPRWTVVCERLTALFAEPARAEFIATGGGAAVRSIPDPGVDPYLAINAEFVAAVRAGRAASAPVGDGLRALELVAAAVDSARDGGRQRLLAGAGASA